MAVVQKYASAANDPSVVPAVPAPTSLRGGRLRNFTSAVVIANGDSATSTVNFGKIPSAARLSPLGRLYFEALTSVTDFDLGDATHVDALINGLDIHTAGNDSALKAVGLSAYGKRLWEVLGYTADPGGDIEIIGTLNTAATAGGALVLHLPYALD